HLATFHDPSPRRAVGQGKNRRPHRDQPSKHGQSHHFLLRPPFRDGTTLHEAGDAGHFSCHFGFRQGPGAVGKRRGGAVSTSSRRLGRNGYADSSDGRADSAQEQTGSKPRSNEHLISGHDWRTDRYEVSDRQSVTSSTISQLLSGLKRTMPFAIASVLGPRSFW